MTMVREPVREDDDTVVRARPRSASGHGRGLVPEDQRDAPLEPADGSGSAARHADRAGGGDPYGDTVIRPVRRAARSGAGSSVDDTVVRARPVGAADAAAPPPDDRPVRRQIPSVRVGGRVLRLDRPLVVGRRPAAPRVAVDGGPVLVTVPSPSGQVSSSHLLVHAEGEAAVVEDLRSTNGTVVRPPGAAPFRMAAGASIVVLTGTLVEIGDGNVIEVLSPHLRVGPDDGLPPFPPAP